MSPLPVITKDSGDCDDFFALAEPSIGSEPGLSLCRAGRHHEECRDSNDQSECALYQEEPPEKKVSHPVNTVPVIRPTSILLYLGYHASEGHQML